MSKLPNEANPPSKSKSNFAGWVMIAVVALVVLALRFSAPSGDGRHHPLVGAPLDRLSLKALSEDAPPITAGGLHGKVTLINFWGTWCGPCQLELPELIQLHRQFRHNADFQFISVTLPQGPGTSEEQLRRSTAARLDELGAEFGFYSDPGGAAMDHLAMLTGQMGLGVPTTLVVDRASVIRGFWIGYSASAASAMEKTIRQALKANAASDGNRQI